MVSMVNNKNGNNMAKQQLVGSTISSPKLMQSDAVVVRFAEDSSDGMRLIGGQFKLPSALAGNDFGKFPDFPPEIRAPSGA
jgi:hypothetical protein